MTQFTLFDPKKINLPYTLAIFKPDLVLKTEIVKEILSKIEKEDFIVKQMF